MFKTNDTAWFRLHKDDANLIEDTLVQLGQIARKLRKAIYSIKRPEFMLFNMDSALLDTYGIRKAKASTIIIRLMAIIRCCVTMD